MKEMQRFLTVLSAVCAGALVLIAVPYVSAQYNEYHYEYGPGGDETDRPPPMPPPASSPSVVPLRPGNSSGTDNSSVNILSNSARSPASADAGISEEDRLDQCVRQSAAQLHMRRLWMDHAIWMRQYIVAMTVGSPDMKAAAIRLASNHRDIGATLGATYGSPAGERIVALLDEHLLIATQRLDAAGAHDQVRFRQADDRWYQNEEVLADFLSGLNSTWSKQRLIVLFDEYMGLLTQTSIARLQNTWSDDVAIFDRLIDNAVATADMLAALPEASHATVPGAGNVTSSSVSSRSSLFSPAASFPAAAEPNAIAIREGLFGPDVLRVKRGTTVKWTNQDTVMHTVTADESGGPRSSLIPGGGTYSYTFTKTGTFRYHCEMHPGMRGTVEVSE